MVVMRRIVNEQWSIKYPPPTYRLPPRCSPCGLSHTSQAPSGSLSSTQHQSRSCLGAGLPAGAPLGCCCLSQPWHVHLQPDLLTWAGPGSAAAGAQAVQAAGHGPGRLGRSAQASLVRQPGLGRPARAQAAAATPAQGRLRQAPEGPGGALWLGTCLRLPAWQCSVYGGGGSSIWCHASPQTTRLARCSSGEWWQSWPQKVSR